MDDVRKRQVRVGLVLGGLLLVLAGGGWLGWPRYQRWKQDRFLAEARRYFAQSDLRNASLCARKVLAMNPRHVEACRLMAALAEAARSPEVLNWWRRIVELEPGPASNRLALARVAFVCGDLQQVDKALQGIRPEDRHSAAYHEMAALLAAARQQIESSEAHFAEAARLDPENKRLQLNLAVLHLQAREEQVANEAHRQLEQLSLDEKFRLDALRVLLAAAMRTNDFAGALARSTRLVAEPGATLEDRLTHLDLLARVRTNDFPAALAALQEQARRNAEHVYGLAIWMLRRGQSEAAWRWLTNLPPDLKPQWPVVIATVETLMERKEWTALETLLREREWAELEFVRQAFLARVSAEQRQEMARQMHWRAAVRGARGRLRAQTALAQMAHAWNWSSEKEELLWAILERFPAERWTLQELERDYHQAGNTRGLHKVYAAALEYNARSVPARNNFVATALLLKTGLERAHRLAAELYAERPDDPVVVSTHAYSLHLQGRSADGLRVLEKLRAEQLETPSVAAYYGALLAANGEAAKAKPFLELAVRAPLLPEEKALVQAALAAR